MNPIQAKNGYLIFKTGSINIPINYEYHYLSVNLTKTEQTFANLIKQAEEYGTIAQIQYLTEKLDREMNGIRIIKRNKRGLINIIGTAYKYLFGTLDQNDKEELEQKIYDLSQHSIQINELNEVIEVVNRGIEVINHFSAISEGELFNIVPYLDKNNNILKQNVNDKYYILILYYILYFVYKQNS